MEQVLRGLFPVLPTPFDKNEEIVVSDLKNMVDFAVECGVQGVVVNEFFSEFYMFTDKERKQTVEAVCRYAEGKLPVIVGACATTPMRATYWAEHAQDCGAAAVLVSGPYLFPYPWKDLVDRGFRIMNQRMRIPIIVQNAPADKLASNLNAGLSRDQAVALMREFEHVQYFKEDSNGVQIEITRFLETANDLPEGACKGIFTGAVNGSDFHDDYLRGAAGFMAPLHMADVREKQWQALQKGDLDLSLKIQFDLAPLLCFERLFQLDVCKDVLKRRGVIENMGSRRRNMTVYNAETRREFQRVYDYLTASGLV